MSKPIFDPNYWRLRAIGAAQPHHAVFVCDTERWLRIARKHTELLLQHVGDHTSILDAGCGYGRLLSMMPVTWQGPYVGVDISPHFISMARSTYATHFSARFVFADLREIDLQERFDLAVCISLRPMVVREAGQAEWDKIEAAIRRHASRILYLEYDEHDGGSLE